MKLIHTADILLDSSYAALALPAAFGNRRRQGLRDALKRVLAHAVEQSAAAVLIAGNLFDSSRVTRDTVAFLQTEFDAARPLPILIAPGRSDPYGPGSPYAAATWPSNVTIFDSPAWQSRSLETASLIVHGYGLGNPAEDSVSFESLAVTPRAGWGQVALAPGTHAVPHVPGLDYAALGGSSAATRLDADGTPVAWHSGPPEGHGFDETGPRHFLEIEMDEAGVRVVPVASSGVVFTAETIDCSGFAALDEAVAAVRDLAERNACPQVARATFVGVRGPDLVLDASALQDAAGPAFDVLLLVDATTPVDDYAELARENTCLGMFVRKMNEELEDAPDDARRRFVARARELGLAAYRPRHAPIPVIDEG